MAARSCAEMWAFNLGYAVSWIVGKVQQPHERIERQGNTDLWSAKKTVVYLGWSLPVPKG